MINFFTRIISCVWIGTAAMALAGCASSSPAPFAPFAPPVGPEPRTVYTIETDYETAWNALVSALKQMPDVEVWYKAIEEGRITLRDAKVPAFGNCLCGTMDGQDLRGLTDRATSIDVAEESPQLTRVRIRCSYALPFANPGPGGLSSTDQAVECVSTGHFEQDLFQRALKLLPSGKSASQPE